MSTTPEKLRLAADIIEGKKAFQYRNLGTRWSDGIIHDDIVDMLHSGYEIRPKPLEWPPIPDGCSLHNPDNLTPEQVGDGHRLLVDAEITGNEMDGLSMWDGHNNKWGDVTELWTTKYQTFRLPISTPFPCGSQIVDGKLVKPWVPKFSVGQKVKVIASTYDPVNETKALIGHEGAIIKETEKAVNVRFAGYSSWHFAQADLEPVPWSLSRHIPGFRPLRDGEEWHREDWTEDMLPEGWRPLLKGEPTVKSSTPESETEYRAAPGSRWSTVFIHSEGADAGWGDDAHLRTKRPLPEPKKQVPLGPSDVPPGSSFMGKNGDWFTPYEVYRGYYKTFGYALSLQQAFDDEWQIRLPGQTEWKPCSKEAP